MINNIKKLGKILDIYFKNQKIKNIKFLETILKKYNGNDWKKFIKYDDKKYQRIKCYNGYNNLYGMYVITWNKKQKSIIHGHPDKGCLLKVLDGKLLEKRYKNNCLIQKKKLKKNNVDYIHDKIAKHQIINNNLFPSFSFHIYSPPL